MRRTCTIVFFGEWNDVRRSAGVIRIDVINAVAHLSWEFEKSWKANFLGGSIGDLEHAPTAGNDVQTIFTLLGFLLHNRRTTLAVSGAKKYGGRNKWE